MKYYLDTNVIIYCVNGKYKSILEHLSHIPSESIVIPSVVVAEIEYGCKKSTNYNANIVRYRKFIDVFNIVSFDENMAKVYGTIRDDLEKRKCIIGPNDLIIAATVLNNNGILVTHNTKEFERVRGLQIEDWTK